MKIHWVILSSTVVGKILTKRDVYLLNRLFESQGWSRVSGGIYVVNFFASKEKAEGAISIIQKARGLSKDMTASIITDLQFGKITVSNGIWSIPFTTKQLDDSVLIKKKR